MFVRSTLCRQIRRYASQAPPPPSNAPPPPSHSTTTKLVYGGVVFGGYVLGVQQSVFLDIRELPALLQRMYDRTLGNKDATANILNSVDGTRVADHGAKATVTDQVYLDVAIGEQALVPKRIVLGLYHDVAPKTCDNFETLCMGHTTLTTAQKKHKLEGKPQSYVQSPFHRIIPNFMIQGGDWTKKDGTGGRSIFPHGSKFRDEAGGLDLKHSGAGTLSMANAGPNTNSSQFFITLAATPHLNGRHVVFGKVISGMDVVREIEQCGTRKGTPTSKVIVVGSGLISRSSHQDRDLSWRSSKWLRQRLKELRRMKQEESIVDVVAHEKDMKLLKALIKERMLAKKKNGKVDAKKLLE